MFYIYVLKSQKDGKLYIGRTTNLKKRFEEHNLKLNNSTKNRTPFILIYYEAYKSARDATRREVRLKRFKNSYSELKKRLKYSIDTG